MLPLFRLILIAMLVMLQLLAPLVHAHTRQNAFNDEVTGKLHMPGLETLNLQGDEIGQYLNATATDPSEGLAVGIDHGIKQSSQKLSADTAPTYYLDTATWLVAVDFITEKINFSPHLIPLLSRFSVTSHTPRAPPALA